MTTEKEGRRESCPLLGTQAYNKCSTCPASKKTMQKERRNTVGGENRKIVKQRLNPMSNEPKQEELQKFWEKFGWRYGIDEADPINPEHLWFPPGSTCCRQPLPALTLDNLFKYAVPKLPENVSVHLTKWARSDTYTGRIGMYPEHYSAKPELALFRAIQEAIK